MPNNHESAQPADNSLFSVEEVARWPLPGLAVPTAFTFSPDDRLVTYLLSPGGDLQEQLMAFDPATGLSHPLVTPRSGGATEENLTLQEQLRRERQRQSTLGVTQYTWNDKTARLLIPQPEGLYVQDGVQDGLGRVLATDIHPALDPAFSPDGAWIAYVQDAELYIVPAAGGAARQLTSGARGTGRTHGLAEYIAQEEMGRSHGYWWSPDSQRLAFTEVDEAHIPIYRIVHQGKDQTDATSQEDHRYPFAGQPNARVRLGVIEITGGEPAWLDLGADEDSYLARVDWLPDGSLAVQVQNRAQTVLDLVRFDLQAGTRTLLLRETGEPWINLHDAFRPLAEPQHAGAFIWASERTGFRHLHLYDRAGGLIRKLTGGEWQVDALVGGDEVAGRVYFTGTRASPLESHLYSVSLDGGEVRQITTVPGMHTVVLDHACRRFVDSHNSLRRPPALTLRSLDDGAPLAVIYDRRDPRIAALGLEPPGLVSLQNRTGVALCGAIYRPPVAYGPGPYPTVVSVYGGPHAQMVTNGWQMTAAMRAQYLCRLGFLVFVLDNRGSARRGLAFEGAIRRDMGHLEVEDQVDGVRWLVDEGLTDPDRVGIYGWSYGGYMSAMCLARAPETFKVAVAGAPVTSWDGYDTHYTERYMDTPQNNPEGYASGSVLNHVGTMTGSLLLIHGLIDENVHFRHTARLINALIAARKPYELLLFPDERHMPRRLADRDYMEERLRDFLVTHLQPDAAQR
jgi:dipeptidyl-peptidase 4